MALTPGTRLGPYEIAAQIGEGGMGEVYRATDTKLDRHVAIKVLPASLAGDPDRIARFQREAKTLAALNHPNIAQIHGLEEADGVTALVMELVEGPTLADRIAQGAIPVDEALPIAKQIAEALEAAHEQGIIHRDLKPANVKVRPDGTVKVLDFGLAKALEPTGTMSPGYSQSPTITSPAMTQAGVILGTAAYMSPEQARGKPVDRRSDIWAFGALLYEMLSGRRAFAGDDISDTLANVLKVEAEWTRLPAAVPARVRQAIRACLHKDPKQRVHDIADVRLALEGAFETAVGGPGAQSRRIWQRPVSLVLVGLTCLLVGALIALGLSGRAQRTVVRFSWPQPDLPEGAVGTGMGRRKAAIAPTGDLVAFVGTQGLWVRFFAQGDATLVPGTAGAVDPVFSPDGQSLAFFRSGWLYRIPVTGAAPVPVCRAGDSSGASWESDDTILFGQQDGVWRVSASGGDPQRVISIEEGEAVHGPRMLPGGRLVLFTWRPSGFVSWDAAQIVVQSLENGTRTVLVQGGRDAHYASSGHLVYAVNNTLLAQAVDLTGVAMRGNAVAVAEGVEVSPGITGAAMFDLSGDGTLIYLPDRSRFDELYRLAWADRQGRLEPLGFSPDRYSWPRLSPNGRRAVTEIFGSGGESAIWVLNLERGVRNRITSGSGGKPVWAPDGQYVIYRGLDDGESGFFRQSADGTGEPRRLVTISGTPRPGNWSKDGRLVFALLQGDDAGVAILTTEGEPSWTPLLDTDEFEFQPQVSPDGDWIAYTGTGDASGRTEVFLQRFPGLGERQQISNGGGRDPVWSADGELFYLALARVDAPARIVSASIDVGPPFSIGTPSVLFDYMGPGFGNGRQYDIHPDGQRFLVLVEDAPGEGLTSRRSDLHVVLNWTEELKRLVPTE